jgi:hypothetical protein
MPLLLVVRRGKKGFVPTQMSVTNFLKLVPDAACYFSPTDYDQTIIFKHMDRVTVEASTLNDSVSLSNFLPIISNSMIVTGHAVDMVYYKLCLSNELSVSDDLTTRNFRAVILDPCFVQNSIPVQTGTTVISKPNAFQFNLAGLGMKLVRSEALYVNDSVQMFCSFVVINASLSANSEIKISTVRGIPSSGQVLDAVTISSTYDFAYGSGSVWDKINTASPTPLVSNPATFSLTSIVVEQAGSIRMAGSVINAVDLKIDGYGAPTSVSYQDYLSMSLTIPVQTSAESWVDGVQLVVAKPILNAAKTFNSFTVKEVGAVCAISSPMSAINSMITTNIGSISPPIASQDYSAPVEVGLSAPITLKSLASAPKYAVAGISNVPSLAARDSSSAIYGVMNGNMGGANTASSSGIILIIGAMSTSASSTAHS